MEMEIGLPVVHAIAKNKEKSMRTTLKDSGMSFCTLMMDSHLSMSVDNIDIDMQHPDIQPEDVQTSHDADLFKDDEDKDDNESGAGHFTDALTHPPTSISQPPTSAMRIDKRARDEVVCVDSTNQLP
jgi:hypothetical protein